jgi:ribosome-binding factor A
MTSIKQERMAERIRQILSELFLTEVSDPAIQGLTVTEVRLDREMEYATIYVNALGDEDSADEVMAGLRRANGFLRREVAQRVRLRRAPELRFHWDDSLERGAAMDALLSSLNIPPADKTPDQDGEA